MNARKARFVLIHHLLMLVWVLALCGMRAPTGFAGIDGDEGIDLGELQVRVGRLADRVTELAGKDDLLDTLHFGWFDRPYARSTLAVLVKTTFALQREVRLREHRNGAISDPMLQAMLTWSNHAVQRVAASTSDAGFRPHRLRVTGADLAEAAPTPALFAVVDRATATRYHRSFGDLDLAAAMGFRVYPRLDRGTLTGEAGRSIIERAATLGMATVVVAPAPGVADGGSPRHDSSSPGDASSARHALIVEPATLRTLLRHTSQSEDEPGRSRALIDPALGESWASSLARRALARGVFARIRYVADGWTPPPPRSRHRNRNAAVAAAMWVHAFDGQSLGLLHGWRDLRDGSASPYPSLSVDPAKTEAIAHTALDLIRLGNHLTPFRSTPVLALAVGDGAIDAHDDNTWARWIEPVWMRLLERQTRFDVVPLGTDADRPQDRYRVVCSLGPTDAADVESLLLRLDRMLAGEPEHTGRITVRDLQGRLAADVFVREGRTRDGGPCVAVANLSGSSRILKLNSRVKLGTMRDVIADADTANPQEQLKFEAWQVRLLWPAK